MNGLLVRVGADGSDGGGRWNGPVDTRTGGFVYVPIPETNPVHTGLHKPYIVLTGRLSAFGMSLPPHLSGRNMHLDPDFEKLTYGDQGERAKQLKANLTSGDLIVFYASLRNVKALASLVYAVVGIYIVESFMLAATVHAQDCDINAHSRRVLSPTADDLIVKARPGVSGRLQHCIPVGEYRNRAYRVTPPLLTVWGGLSCNDGYLQRSVRLPLLLNASRFYSWFLAMKPTLLKLNN